MERWRPSGVLVVLWVVLGACSGHTVDLSPRAHTLGATQADWIPLNLDEPRPAADARELQNCAEYPFTPPPRGPWESVENQDRAQKASIEHRTTDHVARVGDSVTVSATMGYDLGPVDREWVRLFLGDCDGWTQVGIRRTDEEGRVAFRLPERQASGVYGMAFQVVGDASTVRSQLWVAHADTEVVAVSIDAALAEPKPGKFSTDSAAKPSPVEAADELLRWHADRGHLVIYVGHSEAVVDATTSWRKTLRRAELPVGPVVDLGGVAFGPGTTSTGGLQQEGWGESKSKVEAGPPIEVVLKAFYASDKHDDRRLLERDIKAEKVVRAHQECSRSVSGETRRGWTCVVAELIDEATDDLP